MATSLVSTGVQFPDSSIQTTAASASGLVLLTTVTASSSSTVDIETGIGSSYDFYVITVTNVRLSNENAYLQAQMKLGGSYQTSSYRAMGAGGYSNGSGVLGVNQSSADSMWVSFGSSGTNAASVHSGEFWFSNPTSTTVAKVANWNFGVINYDSNSFITTMGAGSNNSTTAALTGIRFLPSSSNMTTGTFRLYGFAK